MVGSFEVQDHDTVVMNWPCRGHLTMVYSYRTMTRPYLLATSCFLLASSCVVSAQANGPRRGPVPPLLQAVDLDKDGEISASELETAPESLLTLDKDGDHRISSAEMRPPPRGGNIGRGPGRNAGRRGGGPRPTDIDPAPLDLGAPGIAWYGRFDLALQEAKRSNRPILFMAAASQCSGVPGVF